MLCVCMFAQPSSCAGKENRRCSDPLAVYLFWTCCFCGTHFFSGVGEKGGMAHPVIQTCLRIITLTCTWIPACSFRALMVMIHSLMGLEYMFHRSMFRHTEKFPVFFGRACRESRRLIFGYGMAAYLQDACT